MGDARSEEALEDGYSIRGEGTSGVEWGEMRMKKEIVRHGWERGMPQVLLIDKREWYRSGMVDQNKDHIMEGFGDQFC